MRVCPDQAEAELVPAFSYARCRCRRAQLREITFGGEGKAEGCFGAHADVFECSHTHRDTQTRVYVCVYACIGAQGDVFLPCGPTSGFLVHC